jgi:hypothetical protein
MSEDAKTMLEVQALREARAYGHTIAVIVWDEAGQEGSGTCTRCGDGLLLYLDREGASIQGTAFASTCPGNTCAHGWSIIRLANGGSLLRCLHCGAERSEG